MRPRITKSNTNGDLTKDALASFEGNLGCRLPKAYRKYLLKHNGGTPEPDAFLINGEMGHGNVREFFGVHDSQNSLQKEIANTRDRMPPEMIPIGESEGGNYICICVQGDTQGSVWFWDHEEEMEEGEKPGYQNLHQITDSFSSFIKMFEEIDVELDPSQVTSAWVDPEFAKKLGMDVPSDGWIKKPEQND